MVEAKARSRIPRGTLDEFFTLGADDLGIMRTWVDASYAVHEVMKSHTTGGILSFLWPRSRYEQIPNKS
jgi:hypothetical protein